MRLVNLFSTALLVANAVSALPVQASSLIKNKDSIDTLKGFGDGAGFETSDNAFALGLAEVLKAWFGLLGIIFLVLILIAGYNWMTAGGEAGKVDTAKKLLTNAAIGFLITVSAYAITYFVFSSFSFK